MKYFIANLYFYTRNELLAIADGKDELVDFLDRIKGSELESAKLTSAERAFLNVYQSAVSNTLEMMNIDVSTSSWMIGNGFYVPSMVEDYNKTNISILEVVLFCNITALKTLIKTDTAIIETRFVEFLIKYVEKIESVHCSDDKIFKLELGNKYEFELHQEGYIFVERISDDEIFNEQFLDSEILISLLYAKENENEIIPVGTFHSVSGVYDALDFKSAIKPLLPDIELLASF
ncbi:hypothetical protein VP396_19705 (plasmid) [Acinetobacter baumannii]|uniref:Uncharacterized protein n=1 Tax=Acinetobacter baumannii TaxID=470 RepID=A0A1S2FW72_ACIBA|nr:MULTISPECIES: hypothetical protein [Acinetobacter calcoaceticus/baumannii complex]ADX05356.1 Hypothetical protein ABK1_3722 [Acinetobacter baumannii 1656-2]AOX75597.1 hypothetical protein KAB02_03930 [Acinetobacter baumannii]AOX95006.1 hypothetical protein KAB07_03929 [Acinetobacter baumannii]AOX98873.1 hypothetical protein KAB08_03939 [Acinetobacter baumannii]ARF94690.1 hypothetical protein B7L38_00245 [Acinetobacter baumannii]